jgi:hypothetical protein
MYFLLLVADQRGFELPIGFPKYPFEMSAEFPIMSAEKAY